MVTEIKAKLSHLKLAGMTNYLEEKLEYAQSTKLSYLDFLLNLLEVEEISRKNNSLKKRAQRAKLQQPKRLEEYDFNYQPSLNKMQILELGNCSFIEKKENIIFIGKPGTGKTHLSRAIGMKALLKGYKVLFTSAHDLILKLHQSKADGTYQKILKDYVEPDLLIIDEIGFKKFTQAGADDLFEIVNQRYERKSIIITSNKNFEDWSQVLFDPVLAAAMVDRLVHHSHLISIKGPSYRTKNYKENKIQKEESENALPAK